MPFPNSGEARRSSVNGLRRAQPGSGSGPTAVSRARRSGFGFGFGFGSAAANKKASVDIASRRADEDVSSRREASAPCAASRAPRAATRARARATTDAATIWVRRAWHCLSHATPSSMSRGSSAARTSSGVFFDTRSKRRFSDSRAFLSRVETPSELDTSSLRDEHARAMETNGVLDPDGSASPSRSSLGLLPSATRAARCGSRGAPVGAGWTPLCPAATVPAARGGANGWFARVSSREPRSAIRRDARS